MKQQSQRNYSFNELKTITTEILESNKSLVYLAGASASGKSYIGEELVAQLQQAGKKVLLISSDSYYSNESNLKHMLYGTFDHPKLIDYALLQSDLEGYFCTGKINIPHYSFIEKRRTHLTEINEQFDIVVVEGLYTIGQLKPSISLDDQRTITAYKIFVEASSEEILFRRLIRDQSRVKEPLHAIIEVMSTVFPMRTVFGNIQHIQSDCKIINDYKIIMKEGKEIQWNIISQKKIATHREDKIHYTTNYVYNNSDNSGKIIISEIYTTPNGLLDHVIISKTNADPRTTHRYQTIDIKLYHPAISTELHSLLQLAGVKFDGIYEQTTTYYYNNQNNAQQIIIKDQDGIQYQLTG